MDVQNYIDLAMAHGYGLRFTGIGMAYVVIGDVLMTEAMDIPDAEAQLAEIGMAIMTDHLRQARGRA